MGPRVYPVLSVRSLRVSLQTRAAPVPGLHHSECPHNCHLPRGRQQPQPHAGTCAGWTAGSVPRCLGRVRAHTVLTCRTLQLNLAPRAVWHSRLPMHQVDTFLPHYAIFLKYACSLLSASDYCGDSCPLTTHVTPIVPPTVLMVLVCQARSGLSGSPQAQ